MPDAVRNHPPPPTAIRHDQSAVPGLTRGVVSPIVETGWHPPVQHPLAYGISVTSDDPAHQSLPYRPCVGLMLLNRHGRIFAGQRLDNRGDAWQMPQGGIDPGESPRDAALRELTEETGIAPAGVEVLRESAYWHRYDLPASLIAKLWDGQYRGQAQRWFALRYTGPDDGVNIETPEPEFRAWAWMDHAELIQKIVPFKRDTYTQVFDEFLDLIGTPA